ncbi:hypothetical protein BDN70DRAFT_890666 [Pholiota conissans]|uniref:Uncharacterized protein n=1 Tax=Pholiota conissans TaxID=109636 RepID=A0A9P5ZAU5_9AGAR|nr:hypothetical protein BDN70DRAFT_890666 [Pholiota conissans]
MPHTIRLRALLRFTIVLACWLQVQQSVLAAQNVTVQDTDSAIDYQPPESWLPSTSLCSTCLNPGTSTSFHEAIHPPAGGPDADDLPTTSSTSHNASPTSGSPSLTSDSDSGSHKSSSGKNSKRAVVRPVIPRLDPDDAGFVDPTVSMAFNFTGTAVYLFATQPPNVTNANETSSNMNLTFFVDNAMSKSILSNSPSSNYLSGQLVFSKTDLAEGPHELLVQVGQNSTFIFESLIYTTEVQANSSTSPQSSPSPSVDPMKEKKHDVATFGAAVGGSVGVLALFSLGLALSIIRRRHLAALRERRDHESLYTNASDDSPRMYGPAPFVPRYFPDTVIPTEPPTYMAALATNANNSTLLASLSPEAFGSTPRSYADIPPSIPPPPLDETLMIPPPPPFPIAMTTPPLAPASSTIESSSSSSSEEVVGSGTSSHSTTSVGTDSLGSAPAPELVPLLQPAAVADTRPRSRASARSVADIQTSTTTPVTEATNLREDVS